MQVLAVIPARAGSRGIPLKNLAVIAGKSLLCRAIESAQAATRISRLIVSTESREIAKRALECKCSVELRPDELATDEATTIAVLQWHLAQADVKPDAVLCLQPTCPLRRAEDIDGAIALMERTDCDSVLSYCDVGPNHPARMVGLWADNRVRPSREQLQFASRQHLPPLYIRSGDIYLTRANVLSAGSLIGDDCRAFVVPAERHCNIDQPVDLVTAEALVKHWESRQ